MPDIDLHQLLREEHQRAKDRRAGDGFQDESFLPYAYVVAADGSATIMALALPKPMAMQAVWTQAHKDKAIAVFLSSDARIINLQRYGLSLEQAEVHRVENLRAVGGDFGNLPREVWQDVVITWCKGPDFPDTQIATEYSEGPEDTVVYADSRSDAEKVTIKMLPDWW